MMVLNQIMGGISKVFLEFSLLQTVKRVQAFVGGGGAGLREGVQFVASADKHLVLLNLLGRSLNELFSFGVILK